jgi:hypothetical protein
MTPSIGRIVHYTNLGDKDGKYPPEVQAAVVTGVYHHCGIDKPGEIVSCNTPGQQASSTFVDLKIFYRTGEFTMREVPYSEVPARGHWNWPPKV